MWNIPFEGLCKKNQKTIAQALSVNDVQVEARALRQAKGITDGAEAGELPLPQRVTQVTQQLKKAKVWDDPKKKRRLEKLLSELSALVAE